MMRPRSKRDCILSLIDKEGGYSNNPQDPGGITKYGITQRMYSRYVGRPITETEMQLLTVDEAARAYDGLFWTPCRLGSLKLGLAHFMLDSVVQHGQSAPVKWLQKMAGIETDGNVGPLTIAAVNACDTFQLIRKLSVKRGFYYEGLETYGLFKNGWKDRLTLVTIESVLAV